MKSKKTHTAHKCGCTEESCCDVHLEWDEKLLAKVCNTILRDDTLMAIDDLIFMIFKMEAHRKNRAKQ